MYIIPYISTYSEHVKENKKKTFTFKLIKGNTRETLTDQKSKFDMALIGGGNSIASAKHDFDCVKKCDVVIGDHYFRADDDNLIPHNAYQGVNEVFESIDKKKFRLSFLLHHHNYYLYVL